MDWFKMIKGFYPKFWNKSMVGDAVVAGKITEPEYKEIVGEPYDAEIAEKEPDLPPKEPLEKK